MTTIDQLTINAAIALYKKSDEFHSALKDLAHGASFDEDHFIQGVSDGAYSFLAKHFDEEDIDDLCLVTYVMGDVF